MVFFAGTKLGILIVRSVGMRENRTREKIDLGRERWVSYLINIQGMELSPSCICIAYSRGVYSWQQFFIAQFSSKRTKTLLAIYELRAGGT